jgi:hypothetical protein
VGLILTTALFCVQEASANLVCELWCFFQSHDFLELTAQVSVITCGWVAENGALGAVFGSLSTTPQPARLAALPIF